MKRTITILLGSCLLLFWLASASAATVQEAEQLAQEQKYDAAAEIYRGMLQNDPQSVRLRLALADTLAWGRHWDEALAEYETVLSQDPKNVEAMQGVGTVQRWWGHFAQSKQAFDNALSLNPDNRAATLGLAAAYELDHDYAAARATYDEAARKWPEAEDVKRAAYNFKRLQNPALYLYFENDLSFETRRASLLVPFLSREEVGVEYQHEDRPGIWNRKDMNVLANHYYGVDHDAEFRYRHSSFSYSVPPVGFAVIDSFDEFRVGYRYPVLPDHNVRGRYTWRPTKLLLSGQKFSSHKVEVEWNARWSPRIRTVLGTGWLRDLPETATTTGQLSSNTLLKLGLNVDITSRIAASGKFITNPDLDSTIDNTMIAQGDYSINNQFAGLARYILDNYKTGNDQTSMYLALRYTPNAHIWAEGGVKYVKRGNRDGFYPLISVVLRL